MLIAAWALGLRIQPDSGEVTLVPPRETQEASIEDLMSEDSSEEEASSDEPDS